MIGRKGSGKTAIFKKMIRERAYDRFAFGHTFSDYPWHHHQLQSLAGVPEELRYVQSWQYLILLTVAKVLLNQDQSQPWSDAGLEDLSRLERFVVDSYGTRDPDVTQLFTPSKRLRIRPSLKFAKDMVNAGVDLESLPISELPRVSQEVNRNISDAVINCLNPENNYHICFDELDRGFEPSSSTYRHMLIGLLLAAKLLNDRARQAGKLFSVVVFLRDDIYQILKFEDKNKITESLVSRIEWDTQHTKWTLRQLMERRFTTLLSDGSTILWGEVFDETHEMPGRQSKYKHILDRTFRRPRDFIKMCNEVLLAFREHSTTTGAHQFANEDIIRARLSYSNYFLSELEDEIHKHVPDFEKYLELVRTVGTLQFSAEEFRKACKRRAELVGDETRPIEVLRQLFDFSVIAYQRTGGAGGGSEYVWKYLDTRSRFDETATNFRVHAGLLEALGLKRYAMKDGADAE